MNFREGMRRTGIVLGILGACAGGVLAYADASPLWQAWHEQRRLQALLATPTVRRATGVDWFAKHSPSADRRRDADARVDPSVPAGSGSRLQPRFQMSPIDPETLSVPAGSESRFQWKPIPDVGEVNRRFGERSSADQGTLYWEGIWLESFAPDANRDGISLIRYAGRTVTSLELSTGERLQLCGGGPCPVSFPRTFVVPLLFPLAGFLLPWGSLKTITWVASGFVPAKGA
jgi:hypothetical protein